MHSRGSAVPARLSDRTFGFVMGGALAVISSLAWMIFDTRLDWSLGLSAGFIATALILPVVLMPVNRLWGWFAYRVGVFNSYVILGLIFYLVVSPIAVLMRLVGRDSMSRKWDSLEESYLTPVRRKLDRETMQDMF